MPNRKPKKVFQGLVIALSLAVGLSAVPLYVRAATVSGSWDCDPNAIISCGAHTTDELISKYTGDTTVAHIYDSFGISPADVFMMDAMAKSGHVTKSGNIYVDNKLVATHAAAAGRQNKTGSNEAKYKSVTYYVQPVHLMSLTENLPVFVVMNDGTFDFAVVASTGSPLKARPAVEQPAPEEPAHDPAPEQKPTDNTPDTKDTETDPVEDESPAESVNTGPQTSSTRTEVPFGAEEETRVLPAALPNTGAGTLLGIFTSVTLAGTVAHKLLRKWR